MHKQHLTKPPRKKASIYYLCFEFNVEWAPYINVWTNNLQHSALGRHTTLLTLKINVTHLGDTLGTARTLCTDCNFILPRHVYPLKNIFCSAYFRCGENCWCQMYPLGAGCEMTFAAGDSRNNCGGGGQVRLSRSMFVGRQPISFSLQEIAL